MKSLRHIFLILVITLANSILSSEDDKSFQEQSMLSVLYAQTSAEFSANNIQTYNNAKLALDRALADKFWTAALEQDGSYEDKMPAIILDVDETVLDNSAFQARTIIEGLSYPNGWVEYVNEENSSLVSGVKDFLLYAKEKGVKVFYVTNRIHILDKATKNNIKALGLPFDDDIDVLLMRDENGWTRDKTSRRTLVAKEHRILLLVGDQLTDFISAEESYVFHSERKKIADKYSNMWGTKWFVITNPMYGRWEYSIYDNKSPESEEDAEAIRINSLRP